MSHYTSCVNSSSQIDNFDECAWKSQAVFLFFFCLLLPELGFLFVCSRSQILKFMDLFLFFFLKKILCYILLIHSPLILHTQFSCSNTIRKEMGWSNFTYKFCMQTNGSLWTRAQVQRCLKKKQQQQQPHIWSFWFFWLTTTQYHTWMHRTRYRNNINFIRHLHNV